MIPHDLLNGLPAKASSPVAGHWIIRFSGQIRVRKYVPSASPPSGGDAVDAGTNHGGDVLERAWRAVNSRGGSEVADGLSHGCGIVVDASTWPRLESKEEELTKRVLCVFSSDSQIFAFPGLEEDTSENPIDPSQLFSCSTHGHDYQCLMASTPPSADDIVPREKCKDLTWDPSKELKERWELFTDALVEGMAWRRGRRVVMRPSPYVYDGYKELSASVRPVTACKLVLQIKSSPLPRYISFTVNRPVLLRPLHLPALVLGPFAPSDAQSAVLTDAFSSALGSTWTMDKAGKQLITELDRKNYAAWTVVWVPLLKSSGPWTSEQGVMTIWPSHLLLDLVSSSSTPIPTVQPPGTNFSASHDDFMASAVEVYESMAIDREPVGDSSVAPIPQETAPVVNSPESPMFGSNSGDKSDLDDLFSTHSEEDGVDDDVGYELLSDLPDDEPAPPAPPQRPVELDRDIVMESAHGQGSDAEEEPQDADVTQITEDDFAFFDSPDADPEATLADAIVEIAEPVEAVEPIEDSVKESPVVESGPSTDPKPEVEKVTTPIVATVVERSPDKPKTIKQVQFAPSPPPLAPSISRSSDETDLIPVDFEPLPVSGGLASFPYTLPSPAATPEDLRSDLLDRLSTPKEKTSHDYASEWDVESEMSDVEEPSPLGPLTPESMTEDEEPGNDSMSTDVDDQVGELRWRGQKCTATEWFWIRRNEVQALAIPWESAWAESLLPSTETVTRTKTNVDLAFLAELDCTRLAHHVIADRHLRSYILAHETNRVNDVEEDESLAWTRQGAPLYDLLEPNDSDMIEASNNPKALPPLHIHAAYAGSVMRLSAAGLRYWTQLGLQPLGGKKDIALSILSEGGSAGATEVLRQLEHVYESLHLGKLVKGDVLRDQVSLVKIPDLLLTLNTRLCQNLHDAVILCITHSPDLRTIIQAAFCSQLIDSSRESFFYHIFPGRFPSYEDLFYLAFELYDRLARPIKPISIRGLPMTSSATSAQSPHFTIVNEDRRIPELTLAWPLSSYDITYKWRLVHCAYAHDSDLGMTVAMVMDGEGQSWHVNTWSGKRVGDQLRDVWSWFHEMAESIAVEHRLAILCPISLSITEIDAWKDLIKKRRVPTTLVYTPVPPSDPLTPTLPKHVPTVPASLLGDPTSRVIDESLSANFASFTHLLPLALASTEASSDTKHLFPHSSFLLNATLPDLTYTTSTYHVVSHDPPPGRDDENINLLLAEDYHRLIGLGRMRFGFTSGSPAHVQGVHTVLDCMRKIASV